MEFHFWQWPLQWHNWNSVSFSGFWDWTPMKMTPSWARSGSLGLRVPRCAGGGRERRGRSGSSSHSAYKTATILKVIIQVEVNSTINFKGQGLNSEGGKQLFLALEKVICNYQGKDSLSTRPIDLHLHCFKYQFIYKQINSDHFVD